MWTVRSAGAPPLQVPQPPMVRSHLVWFDRAGKRLDTIGELADYGNLELSPDGRRVGVAVLDPAVGTRDLWLYDADGAHLTRLTAGPADENWLIWSPDGTHVVFNMFGGGRAELRRIASDGRGEAETLLTDQVGIWPVSWSSDGRYILYVRNSPTTGNDIWVLPLAGDRKPYPLLQTNAAENWAAFSPDAKWIAYSATDTQSPQPEVYVMPFPGGGERRRVSADGGTQARWRRDGKEIVYLAPDQTLMAASIVAGSGGLEVTDVKALFQIHLPFAPYHAFDLAADGQRVLVNTLVVGPGGPTRVARTAGKQRPLN
jgi:Tol biopolymer transport system component